ncbi:unnamed protein product, partial [Meganyctiphanes norvegica]
DVPGPPTGLSVAEESSRHLTLTWLPPTDSNAPISAYYVTFQLQEKDFRLINKFGPRDITVEGDQYRVRIEGLKPSTTYVFTIKAENQVGRSLASPTLTATTQEEPPEGAPNNIRV